MPETRILLIYTGGTIGMVRDPLSKRLVPFDFDHIGENVPELERLKYQINVHSFDPLIDSSEINPGVWKKIAILIGNEYEHYDGFVILHGSDTMAFTASVLSFMLENLGKPVILTGSQLPIGEIRTDARENLITSIEIAASRKNNGPLLPEVCIYFDYRLLRGNRTTKFSSDSFEAFRSFNYPPLAEAGVDINYNISLIRKPDEGQFQVMGELDNRIGVLKLFPGISEKMVNCLLNAENIRAIVLESFGSGNTCTETWFVNALRNAVNRGIIIVDITQCKEGSVELGRYETSRHLREMGVLSGYDLTFESAITKLMYLLGKYKDTGKIRSGMESDLRGEMSRR